MSQKRNLRKEKLKINIDIRVMLVFNSYLCLSHSSIGTSDEPESLNITEIWLIITGHLVTEWRFYHFKLVTSCIECSWAELTGESLSLHFHHPSGALTEGSQFKCVWVLVMFGLVYPPGGTMNRKEQLALGGDHAPLKNSYMTKLIFWEFGYLINLLKN